MPPVPTVMLNNDVEMPLLGFGVYQINDLQECEKSVQDAIATGYRLIDTAASYGNEEAVGSAIKKAGVSREDLFVTSKVWIADAGDERTKQAFERSLQRLQLDYVDLYLIHQPIGDVYGAWRAMQDLHKDGRARAIGVSNFAPDRVMDFIMNTQVVPAVNQIETHPFNQQVETQRFLQEHGIQHESWAPFAEGQHNIFQNETLVGIAGKHNKSVAQIILRWLTQRGVVAIPKSVRKESIEENFNVFDVDLSPEEMEAIAGLDMGQSNFSSTGTRRWSNFSAKPNARPKAATAVASGCQGPTFEPWGFADRGRSAAKGERPSVGSHAQRAVAWRFSVLTLHFRAKPDPPPEDAARSDRLRAALS